MTVILAVAFLVLSMVTTLQSFLSARASGESQSIGVLLAFGVLSWGSWMVLAPGIVWLGRRFNFSPGRRIVSISVHAVAAVVSYAASLLLVIWLGITFFNPEEQITWAMIQRSLLGSSRLTLSLLTYAAILALDRAVRLWQIAAERETRAAKSEAQASRAHLDALAARLHPHFLFNALQSVSALIDEDPARARTMLAQIGDLLRDVLVVPDDGDVSLGEELALLGRYLAIEEIRFADRLRIRIEMAPEVAAVPVPRLLLQPLAENALRHGLAPQPQGGTLHISAARRDGRVVVRIHNDGVPLPTNLRHGVGLAMTHERLAARYGGAASLQLRSVDGGVEAVLDLPG